MSEALLAFHALTGCDFTSAFYRRGKAATLSKFEKDTNAVQALKSMLDEDIGVKSVIRYVCGIYGSKKENVNDVRYDCFIRMAGGHKTLASQVKKINCASLPPCDKVLKLHIKHAHYVSILWSRADTTHLDKDINSLDYGWQEKDGHFIPLWYNGNCLPESLMRKDKQEDEEQILETDVAFDEVDSEEENWSESSGDEYDSD